MKSTLIALLDKSWPPEHSFVDGMLATEATRIPGLRVRLCVSRGSANAPRACRYKRAACLPILHTRRGFGRVWNLFIALRTIFCQAGREHRRNRRVILFVRNDPVYLLAASLLRRKIDRLVFQSSFPHEEYSGHPFKRNIAKWLYRAAGRGVDAVTAVSPFGVERVRRLCPSAKTGAFIPLLSDLPSADQHRQDMNDPHDASPIPLFIYIGAHSPTRELDVVVEAIVKAVRIQCRARFLFVGATGAEIERLSRVSGAQQLIRGGTLEFRPPVPRDGIPALLAQAHIGLSLIPPRAVFREASPTKLAEYMGAGLAVLATNGIGMQEMFVTESGGGVLTDWDMTSIANALCAMAADRERLQGMMTRSKQYASERLQYASCRHVFCNLIDHPFREDNNYHAAGRKKRKP